MPESARAAYEEENAEVEVLFANMEKLKALTKKIQSSLSRLDTSGRSVQDAIRSIYGNTSKLQITNTNIDRINQVIDKIKQPLDRRREEEPLIRDGLGRVGLQDYLESMDRTTKALGDLQHSSMRSNEQAISELNGLLRIGSQELENSFRETLKKGAAPIVALHYLTKELDFPTMSEESTSQLRNIHQYAISAPASGFQSHGRELKTANIYIETRGSYLATSLRDPATASVNTVRKKSPDAIYRRGDCGIGSYAKAIEGLFAAEYENISRVFAQEQCASLHTQTCQSALDDFTRTLKELHNHIINNIITDCFLAYEIVGIVSDLSLRLESRNGNLKQPVQYGLRPIRETANYSLQRLLEDTRSRVQNFTALPADGSPVDVTKDTMRRLEEMTHYLGPLSAILASVGDGNWRSPQLSGTSSSSSTVPTLRSFDVNANGNELFASYAADMIDTLLSSLETKAKALLRGRPAQGIFIANNVAVIDQQIAVSDLHNLLSDASRAKLDAWRKKGTKMYAEAWTEPVAHLRDVQYTNRGSQSMGRPPSGSNGSGSGPVDSSAILKGLNNKDREATKEKFKNFNISFDELVARHKGFRIERDVKQAIARDIALTVEPMYGRFWERYHDIDKGRGKYVKYDKGQLSAVLAGLG